MICHESIEYHIYNLREKRVNFRRPYLPQISTQRHQMVSGSLALLYFLLGFHGGRQGSGPDRGQSPVEWGDFPSVRTFVCPSPPLGHPARSEAQPARPEAQPARPEAQPARPETQPARPEAQPARPEAQSASPEAQPAMPEA